MTGRPIDFYKHVTETQMQHIELLIERLQDRDIRLGNAFFAACLIEASKSVTHYTVVLHLLQVLFGAVRDPRPRTRGEGHGKDNEEPNKSGRADRARR